MRFSALTLLCLAGLSLASDDAALAKGPYVELRSAYLTETLARAHVITLRGELGGSGTLELDPNTCTINAFGDPEVCTEIAALPIDVRIVQAKLADPSGAGRRLFQLRSEKLPEGTTFTLVIPRRRSQPHRLVVTRNDRRIVVPLEPAPSQAKKPEAQLAVGTFRAEQRDGKVTIRATGENESAGYQVELERLPTRIWPPQHKLVRRPPEGAAAQVITPFEVSTSFEATNVVPTVIVHDKNGTHRIPVRQADG